MCTQGKLVLVTAVVSVALPSCISPADRQPARLPVPDASAVGSVVISRQAPDFTERERVIEDPKSVMQLLAFLRAHNEGWQRPWYTFPTPQYTVCLKRDDQLLLVVWVGANWIGGREGSVESENRLLTLTYGERSELLEILGIPKD